MTYFHKYSTKVKACTVKVQIVYFFLNIEISVDSFFEVEPKCQALATDRCKQCIIETAFPSEKNMPIVFLNFKIYSVHIVQGQSTSTVKY